MIMQITMVDSGEIMYHKESNENKGGVVEIALEIMGISPEGPL